MDPYEEVAQQGQAPPLSPAYVPDPIELDKHVPVYVLEPEHPEYHEDLEEDHTDDPADREDGDDEPSDDDDDDDEDEEPTKDEEEEEDIAPADPSAVPVVDHVLSVGDTKAFKTDESAPTPRSHQTRVPFSQTRPRRARKTIRLEPPMSASMEARITEHVATPIPPTSPTYDHAPLGHRVAMIRIRDDIPEEDMPPWRRFVLTAPPPGYDVAKSSAEAGQGLIHSPGHDSRTIARAADKVEDVGYVRALQVSEHRMMNSIEEVNVR
ncbi:hypothetical protein Tco_1463536, partial [Tanacetum coccineum]